MDEQEAWAATPEGHAAVAAAREACERIEGEPMRAAGLDDDGLAEIAWAVRQAVKGCGGGRSNGNSFGPDRVKRSWELAMLDEAQVTFWKLI